MNSLIHCVWTGATFPYRLRVFIKSWLPYLQRCNSDFKLVVWLTSDSYDAMTEYLSKGLGNRIDQKNWSKCLPGLDVLFNRVQINFNSFYVGLIEQLLIEYPPVLQHVFEILHDHKYYTSVSNISRVLVVNCCGGIYTDVDYLFPNQEIIFPKNMEQIIELLGRKQSKGFYMSMTYLNRNADVENQCLILDPNRILGLNPLIQRMCDLMTKYNAEIKASCAMNVEYLGLPATKSLSKSLFTSPEEAKFMKAYNKRSSYELGQASLSLYGREEHKTPVPFSALFGLRNRLKYVDDDGARFYHYQPISRSTYTVVCDFFSRHLNAEAQEFYDEHWVKFRALFSEKDMDTQYLFETKSGNDCGMYSWAHPGYARLNSLEAAVKSIEKHYVPHKFPNRVPVRLILIFFEQIKSVITEHEHSLELNKHLAEIGQSLADNRKSYYISGFATIYLLQNIFNLARNYNSLNFAVELLNSDKYLLIKNVIDPEKKSLTEEDIEAFLRT